MCDVYVLVCLTSVLVHMVPVQYGIFPDDDAQQPLVPCPNLAIAVVDGWDNSPGLLSPLCDRREANL